MRVWSRIALLVVFLFSVQSVMAAGCPLSLAGSTAPSTDFGLSPHGIFRNGNLVHSLGGQVLTTYVVNDVGTLQVAREDFIGSLANREGEGGVAFSNGYLFVSSEAGLEVFDLRNVRAGGSAPTLVHRAIGFPNYRRLAVSGNRLAGLFPRTDLPCYPITSSTNRCPTEVEILDITTLTSPVRVGTIRSSSGLRFQALNDVAFHSGLLITTSDTALVALNITDPANPTISSAVERPGRWLVSSSGGNFLAVGNDTYYDFYVLNPATPFTFFQRISYLAIPGYLTIERANAIRFSRDAFYDEANARFVTMIEEVDPMTLQAARTIAFDVFDFRVPHFEGSAPRVYEDLTFLEDDEVKHDAFAVGNYVYVHGETTGLQSWGACGIATGRIELESPTHLLCGGTEIRGWVTGSSKIVNVELFLDNQALGAATLGGPLRWDVSSPTPVSMWRVGVNLDAVARGQYTLRAIATDSFGTRRQFAARPMFFEGPGRNCTTPRRRAVR